MKLLQGVRVLAVEQYGAGPFGSLQLAQLGADVVKIENLREKGDTGRHVRRDGENLPDNDSLFFQTFNLGKRSIVVDLQKPEGQRILRELARDAEGVMNNLRGDTQEKLGITYAKLKDVNPRIVCVHLTAYGRRGSRKSWPGYDYLMQSEAGYLSVTGEPESPPTRMGLSIIDQSAGVQAALALVSGVLNARTTGIGCDLDVSLYATAIANLSYLATWYMNLGHVQGREPRSSHPNLTPSQLYRTGDGWLFIMLNKEKFWPVLLDALGNPLALSDERFATFDGRLRCRAELTQKLDMVFMQKPTAHWVAQLAGKLPVAPVLNIGEALENPFAVEMGRLGEVSHQSGSLKVLAPTTEINGAPIRQHAAPDVGAHTTEVLASIGYSEERISELRAQKVVG